MVSPPASQAAGEAQVAGAQPAAPPSGPSEVAPAAKPSGASRIPEKLSLQDAFVLALKGNKDIQIAYYAADAAQQGIGSAKGEFDPRFFVDFARGRSSLFELTDVVTPSNASLGALATGIRQRVPTGTTLELSTSTDYERDRDPTTELNPLYNSDVTISVRQDLLKSFGIDINRTSILIAQNNWRVSKEDLRNALIENLFQVESAYWDLYFAYADLKVREQQVKRVNELVRTAEAQVEVGVKAPRDVDRARTSAATQSVSIINAQNSITRVKHRLLRLLGMLDVESAEAEFGLSDAPSPEQFDTTVQEAVEIALKSEPDYARAQYELENARLREQFAGNQRLPLLQLYGDYGLMGTGQGLGSDFDTIGERDYNQWQVGLHFEVPIPNRTARSDYARAQIERRQAQVRVQSAVSALTRDLADAISDLRSAQGRTEKAHEARILAESLLRAEERSYSLGRTESLDVLTAQEALATAERDEVRAQTDCVVALANLFRVQGVLLDKKGIQFVPSEAGR
jgi:outer membrane protein TolC